MMKVKSLFGIVFMAMVLSSCTSDSKEDQNKNVSEYYIKAKVNGNNVKVSYLAQALQYEESNKLEIAMYSGNSLSNIYPFFSGNLMDLMQIKPGSYQGSSQLFFQFYDSNKKGFLTYNANNSTNFNLNILEVTNSYIRGTFDGILYEEVYLTEFVTVTDGEFILPRYYDEYGKTTPD